jgi:hypothetical protein
MELTRLCGLCGDVGGGQAGLLTHGAIRSVVRRQANERSAATCVVSEKPEKPESAAPLSESPAQSPKSPSEMVCDGVLTLLKALGLASATSPTLCQPVARDEPGLVDWVVDSVVEFAFSTVECAKLDLLVSDVNMHPGGSMRAIAPMLPLVKPQGWLVLTMKNFAGGKVCVCAAFSRLSRSRLYSRRRTMGSLLLRFDMIFWQGFDRRLQFRVGERDLQP